MEPPKADFKQRYLVAIVGAVILILVTLIPAFPLFLKAFVPFPKLEDATYLEGTLEVEGEFRLTTKGVRLPRYFVVNASGRHEFYCGYMGDRHRCFSKPADLQDHKIKVWTSTFFGMIQYEIIAEESKKYRLDILREDYSTSQSLKQSPSYYKFKWSLFFEPGVLLLFLCWLIYRHLQVRREILEAGVASSLPSSNSSKD